MKKATYRVICSPMRGPDQVVARNKTRDEAERLIRRHERILPAHVRLYMRKEDR